MNSLSALLRCFHPLSDAELLAAEGVFRHESHPRGTLLLRAGEVCEHFYAVASGVLRTFFQNEDGTERTRLILLPNSMGTVLASLLDRLPSQEFFEVLEDAVVYAVPRDSFYRLMAEHSGWNLFYRSMLERAYLFQNRRIEDRETLDAHQRFRALQQSQPEILRSVSNAVAASYLGISPETLSRLKAR